MVVIQTPPPRRTPPSGLELVDPGKDQRDLMAWAWRERSLEDARKDPNTFMEMGFGFRQHPFQRAIQRIQNEEAAVILISPESGKSTQVTVGRTIWELGNDTCSRHAISSINQKAAKKFHKQIQFIIETNEIVHDIFPWLEPETDPGRRVWNSTQLLVKRPWWDQEGDPSVQCLGVGGSIVASRVDRFVIDDGLAWKTVLQPERRQRDIEWFLSNDVQGRLTHGAKIFLVGVPWTDDDLYAFAAKKRREGGLGYKVLRLAMDQGGGRTLWPLERDRRNPKRFYGFDAKRLKLKKARLGTVEYNRQMRLLTISKSGSYFEMDVLSANMVNRANGAEKPLKYTPKYDGTVPLPLLGPGPIHVVAALDPGIKATKASNNTAIAVDALNVQSLVRQNLYMKAKKMTLDELVLEMVLLHRRFPTLEAFKVEDNGQQDLILQVMRNPKVVEVLAEKLLPKPGRAELELLASKIRPVNTTDRKFDPATGIPSMGKDFENRLWRVPNTRTALLWFRELVVFTPNRRKHTGDMAMCHWFIHEDFERLIANFHGSMEKGLMAVIGQGTRTIAAGVLGDPI